MSRRKTDETLRKPRFAAGTPAYKLSNWITLGVIATGGLFWFLFDRWPQSQKLLKNFEDGKWDFPPEYKARLEAMKLSKEDPAYHNLLVKAQKRAYEREETPREQSYFAKIFTSTPET